ncbi:MAG TPA: DUF4058 family protein [Gemmataceae bacterium]|jgi:hypothetical protein|nr:DUF4058 family protein [Gemmataceae bacterium]
MPVHDWTRVDAGNFHDFHNAWLLELATVFNGGLLPSAYYALSEQHAEKYVADMLALHASTPDEALPPGPPDGGGLTLAAAPPKVRRKLTSTGSLRRLRRTLAIRHVSGHRLIALIEMVSPANKDRAEHVQEFVGKGVAALEQGIHLLLVDQFPPGRYDQAGIHGAVWEYFDNQPYDSPAGEPFTLASYAAGSAPEVYLEHLAVGNALPEMPLLLSWDRYIHVPLETTYQAAFRGRPAFWRGVLEGQRPPDG